jgi:hypothetical protein
MCISRWQHRVSTLPCCAAAADEKVAILTPSLMREFVLKGEDDWVVSKQHNANFTNSSSST